jgi:hypothetical protein
MLRAVDRPPSGLPPEPDAPSAAPAHPSRPDLEPLPTAVTAPEAAPPSRRTWYLAAAIGAGVLLVAILAVADRGSSDWPDEIAGLDRVETQDLRQAREVIEQMEFGDVGVAAAFYGEGDEATLLVERYTGDTEALLAVPLEQVFEGASGGAELMGGGAVDQDASVRGGSAGVDVMCASATFTNDPALGEFDGTICVWQANTTGIVIRNGLTDPRAAISFTQDVVQAIDG